MAINKLGTENLAGTLSNKSSNPQEIEAKVENYTLAFTDKDRLVTMNSGANKTITIPADSSVEFLDGTQIDIANIGTGTLTIAGASGVTLNGVPTILAQNQSAQITKLGTDNWIVRGYASFDSPDFTGTVDLPATTNYDGEQLSTTFDSKADADKFNVPTTNELALRPDGSTEAVRLTNSSMTVAGDVVVNDPSDARVEIRGDAGTSRSLFFRSSSSARWLLRANDTAESGSDAGSNLVLIAFSDSSAATTVFDVARDTGRMRMSESLILDSGVFFGGEAAANLLDDYEEGTFTPSLSYETPGTLSVTYGVIRQGFYRKIGSLVYFHAEMFLASFTKGTASGNVVIDGLPFSSDGRSVVSVATQFTPLTTTSGEFPVGFIENLQSRILFVNNNDNANFNSTDPDSNSRIYVSGCYRTTS